jgi:hypothetical protein
VENLKNELNDEQKKIVLEVNNSDSPRGSRVTLPRETLKVLLELVSEKSSNDKDPDPENVNNRAQDAPHNVDVAKQAEAVENNSGEKQANKVGASITEQRGLHGTFYGKLVGKVGEKQACTEFMSMLETWKKTRYADIEGLKDKFMERADVIECCKSSLESIYTTWRSKPEEIRRENAHEQAAVSALKRFLDFFKTFDWDGLVRSMRREVDYINDLLPHLKDILYELLEIVENMVENAFEKWQDSDHAFSLILEKMDVLVSEMLDMLQKADDIFQQLAPEKVKSDVEGLKSEDTRGLNMDLTEAYDVGGISAKQSQAIARAAAAQECFNRLDQVCTEHGMSQILYRDLLWICNTSMGPELWLLDRNLYKAELENSPYHHPDRVLAWLNRQCVESELLRIVGHFDDASLQAPNFRRRFLAMLNTLEAACKVLPLTSANCFIPTRRRFQFVEEKLKPIISLQDGVEKEAVRKRLKDGEARIKERWNIGDWLVNRKCQRLESKAEDPIQKETPQEECDSTRDSDKSLRWELWRAEARHWEALTLLYSQELTRLSYNRQQKQRLGSPILGKSSHDFERLLKTYSARGRGSWVLELRKEEQEVVWARMAEEAAAEEKERLQRRKLWKDTAFTRRSVMRCLELMDDTVHDFASFPNDTAVRESNGDCSPRQQLHLQDTADKWEARLMGMLSLRHVSCKLNNKSVVVSNMGTKSQSDDLHMGDLASGVRKELHLHEPDAKLAAFLASFLARACPNNVSVFLCDKSGNPLTLSESSSTEAPPIVFVPGGGLIAHISTDERGEKILDFSGKGLSVYSLRLLVEAARADEDLVQASIAGVDMDFSQKESAQKKICKTVFSEMNLQSNRFGGTEDSVESIKIICDIIAITAYNLQILNLSSNKIDAAGAGILAQFLKQGARALERLVLSDNSLENEGVRHLSKSIGEHQGLEFLDLSRNKIRWEGALHLAEAISSRKCHITDLNLAGNSLGSQGLVAIAASLSCNQSIRSLNLSSNKIGDVGVDALAHKWIDTDDGSLHLLTSLDLSENDITAAGAGKLFGGADFDKLAPKLTDLSLSSNIISHTGITKIATRLPACSHLDKLCLETQKPLNEVSTFNEHQLFVKGDGELSSDDRCITEQQAKCKVVSDLQALCRLLREKEDTRVLKGIRHYCQPDSSKSLSKKQKDEMEKGVEDRKQAAKEKWECKAGGIERSIAMKGLKDAWDKAGKPLSNLNRKRLSRKGKEALAGLVECAQTMRTKEPAYYLVDKNYTKALNESLQVRQKCVDDFRKTLFTRLLKPLRSMTTGTNNSKIILHTQASLRTRRSVVKA